MASMFQALQSLRRATIRTIVGGTVVVGTIEVTTNLPSQGRSSELYHTLADDFVTPTIRRYLNPETAHSLAIRLAPLAPTFRPSVVEQSLTVEQTLWQRKFPNPIGLAAGFDKDAEAVPNLLDLGFGSVEIGSVTLQPQPGNPSPRMFRLVDDEAIVNRYGFNSQGANAVEERLRDLRAKQAMEVPLPTWWERLLFGSNASVPGIVGVNLGKNKMSVTPVQDYQQLIQQLGPYADYLVVNVSSPNTPNLRSLQQSEALEPLLDACLKARNALDMERPPALLVKLSPDLTNEQLEEIARVLIQLGVDGIVVTNTTTARPGSLRSSSSVTMETGGLSGRPLKDRSTECIRVLYAATEGRIPIIGVGGVFTASDVYEKLRAGASLVQIYTAMVYQGPGVVTRLRRDLADLLMQNGHRRVEDVVGLDHDEICLQRRKGAIKTEDEGEQFIVDE